MDFNSVIKEQRKELEKIEQNEKIIEREGLEESRKFIQHPNILVITGIRRCGKSIFSYLLVKDSKIGYVNFDDDRLIGLKTEDLDKILSSFYQLYGEIEYIILDEIQNIPKWELFATRLRRSKKVILTGSNSNLLAGDLATHLTGRHIDFRLFPFSFKEFLRLNDFKFELTYTTKEKSSILVFLEEYLKIGGFPEVYKLGKEVLLSIYEDILTKDIVLRYKINKIEDLKKLSKYLISNSSKEITYTKLSKILNLKKVHTISKWVSYLESSFLLLKLERFDFKLKEQFISPKKFYCIDVGLLNILNSDLSENKGRKIENLVALQLQRKKIYNEEIYYWRDYSENEVDFIIKRDNKIIEIIQVSFISRESEINEREVKSLLKASIELKCDNLVIMTWDYESDNEINSKKIKFIPLWKWLLT